MPDLGQLGVWDRYPRELLYAVEDGSYGATCDWGYCNRATFGFARSKSDASEEWLPICLACRQGDFAEYNDEPYPVDEFVSLGELEDRLSEPPRRLGAAQMSGVSQSVCRDEGTNL